MVLLEWALQFKASINSAEVSNANLTQGRKGNLSCGKQVFHNNLKWIVLYQITLWLKCVWNSSWRWFIETKPIFYILKEGSVLRKLPGWNVADMQGVCSMIVPLATQTSTLGIGNTRGVWCADSKRNSTGGGEEWRSEDTMARLCGNREPDGTMDPTRLHGQPWDNLITKSHPLGECCSL